MNHTLDWSFWILLDMETIWQTFVFILRNLIFKALLTFILNFSILSQSLIYDSGFCYMRKFRQVCTCNHNSKKEIHSKVSGKSDCHDANKKTHICSCKKTKNPNEISNLIKQTFFIANLESNFFIHLTKYTVSNSSPVVDLSGYKLTLIKPPKLKHMYTA